MKNWTFALKLKMPYSTAILQRSTNAERIWSLLL